MSITSRFLENIEEKGISIVERFKKNIGEDIKLPVKDAPFGISPSTSFAKPFAPRRIEQFKNIGKSFYEGAIKPLIPPKGYFDFSFKKTIGGKELKQAEIDRITQLRNKDKISFEEYKKSISRVQALSEKSIKPIEVFDSEKLQRVVDAGFTPFTAPVTIPANLVLGAIERNPQRLKSVARIISLNPAPGDNVYVEDVLKAIGVTDKTIDDLLAKIGEPPMAQPLGLTSKLSIIADFIAFGKMDSIIKKSLGVKQPKVAFKREIEKEIKKAKVVKERPIQEAFKSEAGFARIAKGKEAKPKLVPIRGSHAKDVQRKIVEQKFRGDKLNLPDEQLEQINRRLDVLGLKRRQQMSLGEMERVAMDAGISPEMLLNDTAGRIITKDHVIQLHNLQNNLMSRIYDLEKSKLIPENMLKAKSIDKEISKLSNQLDRALTNFVAGNNEIGRAAVANRILARKTLDPAIWLSKAKKLLGEKLDEERLNEITNAIMDLTGKKDINGLANFIANLKKPTNLEKLIILWKSGLLTSPTTQFANFQGNIFMSILESAKDIPATGLDILMSIANRAFGGEGLRTTTTSFGVLFQKAKAIKTGWKEGISYFKTGTYSIELMTKYDMPRTITFKSKYLNTYVQSVLRSLGANDIFFREIAMMESFAKQARLLAKNELKKGIITKAQVKHRIRELLMEPTMAMQKKAIDIAERVTFQNKNVIADMIASGRRTALSRQDITGNLALAGTELVAPFVRTPTNIAARIIDYSPAGFVRAVFKAARPKTRNQEMFVNDIGRSITGTGIIALGAYMAKKGLMTGNAPANQAEREQFFAEGKQPNSFLARNMWWQLSRVSPIGNLLTLGAEFYNQSLEKEGINLIAGTTFGAMKALSEQTFLKGLSGALKAINDPERNADAYIYQSVGSLIPSIIGRTTRSIDPISRRPENIFEAFYTRLPFASQSVAIRRDNFGNKVLVGGGKLNIIDPFNRKEKVDHPVLIEADRIGVPIGLPNQTISGTKLTNKEYSIYQKLQGTILELSLSELVATAQYQKLDIVDRAKEFEKIIREVRTYTNDTIFSALMIKRYDLPKEINPKILRSIIAQLNENDRFKNSNKAKQRRVILQFLRQ